MKNHIISFLILCLTFVTGVANSQELSRGDHECQIIKLGGVPDLPLNMYSCRYVSDVNKQFQGIKHSISTNTNFSDAKIIAIEIIFLEINYFNEYIGLTRGRFYDSDMQMKEFYKKTDDDSFYRGFCFVNKVRHADGRVDRATLLKLKDHLVINKDKDKNEAIIKKIIEDINNY